MSPLARRRFLAWSGTGVGLAAAGVLVGARASGYALPSGAAPLRLLTAWQFVVVEAVGARIVAPERAAVGAYVDATLAELPAADQRDLLRLIGFLEHGAPLLAGRLRRFTALDTAGQDAVLAALEQNPSVLLRGGFGILKALAFLALYREDRSWAALGYGGPVVYVAR